MPNAIDLNRTATPTAAEPAAKTVQQPDQPATTYNAAACPDHVTPAGDVATSGPLKGIRYGREMAAAAAEHHVDPILVAAVAAQESGGPGAINGDALACEKNGKGRGLMQADARWVPLARTQAVFDPAKNAGHGADTLRNDIVRQHGDTRRALQQYNAGNDGNAPGTPTTWPDGKKLNYADSVMRHYADIKAYVEKQSAH
jgi:soluble lytic murein transglycosylase-like protein